jgi:hypothetical protein
MPEINEFQLSLPDAEVRMLGNQVLIDYRAALTDHTRRIAKFRDYFRRWRTMVEVPPVGEERDSNYPVPLIQWNAFTKWAKDVDALFGDDAEIVAVPVGRANYRRTHKIGLYMSWRFFNYMKAMPEAAEFTLNRILYGRAIAYRPWSIESCTMLDANGEPEQTVCYEGPKLIPLRPDEVIVPLEDKHSIQDFSYVIRMYRATPQQLLDGERAGRYQGISKNFEKIVQLAQHGMQRDAWGEQIAREQDEAEGVTMQRPLSSGETVLVLEWYGKWRMPKGEKGAGSSQTDLSVRHRDQSDLVVRYLIDLDMVVGVQDLLQLYPRQRNRRPFSEASLTKDGSYWCMGLAEMLINSEDEIRSNHNLGTEAMQLHVAPPIGYRPASGFTAREFRIQPGQAIPLDDPSRDVRPLIVPTSPQIIAAKEQMVLNYVEKVTGLSDLSMGRQEDRPNAPRTAGQTNMLLQEGNVRISLDQKMLRHDMGVLLKDLWDLECQFADEEVFFRVTEDDAKGLFDVQDGGAVLNQTERDGTYDFDVKFATSIWSREADKEKTLARYQLDMQNPLIVQNPAALWEVTRQAHEALGDPDFERLVPKPPEPDLPVDPKLEWTRLLQGEDIHVNPMDNDELHLTRHWMDMQMSLKERQDYPENFDADAFRKLQVHYQQQLAQLQQKKITQAIAESAIQQAQAQGLLPGANQFQHGLFGGPPNLPPGNATATQPVPYDHPPMPNDQP